MVKSKEIGLAYQSYVQYIPKRTFSFVPGWKSTSPGVKTLSIILYGIGLILLIDKNISLFFGLYTLALILQMLFQVFMQRQYNAKLEKKQKILIGFLCSTMLISFLHVAIWYPYRSASLAKSITMFADWTEKRGVKIDKYLFYHFADLVSGDDPLPNFKKGILLFEYGDIKGAELNIRTAYESNVKNDQLYYLIGKIALLNERYDEANKNLQEAYALNPDYVPTLYNYAFMSLKNGELKKAEELIERAMKKAPNDFEVNRVQGNILLEKGLYEDALQYFDKAISYNTSLAHLHEDKARALVHMSRIDEALDSIEVALRLNPESLTAKFTKGLVLFRKNQFEQAIPFLEDASNGINDSGLARAYLTWCLLKVDDSERFQPMFKQLTEIKSNDAELHYVIGNIFFEQYEIEAALKEVEKAISINGKRAKYHSFLAEIYFEMEQYFMMEQANTNAWKLDDNDLKAYYVRGKYQIYMQKIMEAHETFKFLYQMDPYNAEVIATLAYTFNAVNEREMAYELMNMAYRLNPKKIDVLYMKALLDFERKRYQSAISTAKVGEQRFPNFFEFYQIQAEALHKIGRLEEAINKIDAYGKSTYKSVLVRAKILADGYQAIELSNRLITEYKDRYTMHYVRAERLYELGNYNEAMTSVLRAIALLNKTNDDYKNLSSYVVEDESALYGYLAFDLQYKITRAQGQSANNLKAVDDLIKSNPYFKDAYYYKGNELQSVGNYEEAKLAYQRALETESNFHICTVKNTDIYARLVEIYTAQGEVEKEAETRILLERLQSADLGL